MGLLRTINKSITKRSWLVVIVFFIFIVNFALIMYYRMLSDIVRDYSISFKTVYVSKSAKSSIRNLSRSIHSGRFDQLINVEPVLSVGAEDFTYPLTLDMPDLVRRILNGQSVPIKPINNYNFPILIGHYDKCSTQLGNDKPVSLLILIKTAPQNFVLRDTIRRIWGDEQCWGGRRIVRLFLLGNPISMNPANHSRLKFESDYYADMIQRDFADHYWNNTYKILFGLDWASNYCPNAKLVMFTDDDFFVYPRNVIAYVEGMSEAVRERLISGFVWREAVPKRETKDKTEKRWFVTTGEYPHKFYPPYAAGGLFFVSSELAREISAAAPYTQYLRFDDVFLGIILAKLMRTPTHLKRVYASRRVDEKSGEMRNMLASHHCRDPEVQVSMWNTLECSNFCV